MLFESGFLVFGGCFCRHLVQHDTEDPVHVCTCECHISSHECHIKYIEAYAGTGHELLTHNTQLLAEAHHTIAEYRRNVVCVNR